MTDIIIESEEEAKSLSQDNDFDFNIEEIKQEPLLTHSMKKSMLVELGYDPEKIEKIFSCNSHLQLEDLVTLLNLPDEIQGTCLVCQETVNQIQVIPECSHTFCKTCLSEYIKYKIIESQVLTMPCPSHECRTQISDGFIKELMPENLYSKYERFKEVEELNKDPFLKWCPQVDCTGYDKGSMSKQKLKCNVCGFVYCYYCAEVWHSNTQCKLKQDKELDKWAKNNGVKYCPNCKRKVQKNLGCDHMTCAKCRYEWCWLCGSRYSSSHYNECEVKKLNKKNPPWEVVLKLFFAPLCIPLMCVIMFYMITHKISTRDLGAASFIRRRRVISYFIATVLGIIFTPLFFAIAPFIVSIMMCWDFLRNACGRDFICRFTGVLVGILGTPLLVSCVIVAACGAHILGFFLLIWKLIIFIKRYHDPNFLLPNSRYGYS